MMNRIMFHGELGRVESIPGARTRVMNTALALGISGARASRFAVAFSETVSAALRCAKRVRWHVDSRDSLQGPDLVLSVAISADGFAWHARVAPLVDRCECEGGWLRLSMALTGRVDAIDWRRAEDILTEPSRDELIWQLQTANDALDEHLCQLETQVEERTRDFKLASEEARQANEAKSLFLASMSHEIRTPMNAIINMSQLALETPLDSQQRRYLNSVYSAASHLLVIINDILDFSKIEAGHMLLESAPFSLPGLLEEVVETFRAKVIETGVELLLLLDPLVPRRVRGDSTRLKQVLINLVGNGMKFTSEGTVCLQVDCPGSQGSQGELSRISFSVRDTGIGMTQEQQGRLFQAFTQADASTTRRYGGTGLGLVISQRLVGSMGGKIEVESRLGAGSRFFFNVPIGMKSGLQDEREREPRHGESEALKGRTVVVWDAHDTSARLVSRLLEARGIHVERIRTLEELEKQGAMGGRAEKGALLLEIRTASEALAECVRRVRACRRFENWPLVLMGILTESQAEDLMQEHGFIDFLQKPITETVLLEVLMSTFGLRGTREKRRVRMDSAPEDADFRGARILVAEDNTSNQLVMRELLRNTGVSLVFACNGREALEAVQKGGKFDLVLMDMQMPEMDGLEATVRIRALPGVVQVPIVALTANASVKDQEDCRAAGMNGYLSKPVERNLLFEAIRSQLDKGVESSDAGRRKQAKKKRREKRERLAKLEEEPGAAGAETLPGWELEEAARRLGMTQDAVRKMTLRYLPDLEESLERMEKAQRSGSEVETRREAHTIAGTSAQFGFVAVSLAARAVEHHAAPASDMASPLVETLRRAIEPVLKALAPELKASTAAPNEEAEHEQGGVCFPPELLQRLGEGDVLAARQLLVGLRGPLVRRVEAALESYDFETAMALVNGAPAQP